MGVWIAVAVVLFVLGSIMALKPSAIDVRLDKVRMTARRLELNPKLIACPDWLHGRHGEMGKGMMGQYGIVIEGMKLPHVRYQVVKDHGEPQWRSVVIENNPQTDFSLDTLALSLPPVIQSAVKGLEAKANSINIYWEDIAYVRPASNPTYDEKNIETDLQMIKDKLNGWVSVIESSQCK